MVDRAFDYAAMVMHDYSFESISRDVLADPLEATVTRIQESYGLDRE